MPRVGMANDTPDATRPPDLRGRVALVTGGGRGIGRDLARGLARRGASVILLARSADEIQATVDQIRDHGGDASGIRADLSDTVRIRGLAATAEAIHGSVDVLINNAATVAPLGPTTELGFEQVQTAFALNVHAPIALTGALLPGMLARRWGRIVNVSSGIVEHPEAMVGGNVYTATKSALEAHTLNLAAEIAHTEVTANVYRPGTVDTEMQAYIRDQEPDQVRGGLVERFRRMQTEGTLVTPETSAESLLARLAGPANGAVWSCAESDPTREASSTKA